MTLIFFFIACIITGWPGEPALAAPADVAAADALMQGNHWGETQAREALRRYEQMLYGAGDDRLPLLTRLARTCFVVGDLTDDKNRRQFYDKGLGWSEQIRQDFPGRVEGHYWLALNLAGMADSGSKGQALQLLPRILQELEKAVALDPAYDQAGAHRVLGRIYFEAPGWPMSVGDLPKALQHLTMAARLAPSNSTNHLYLAEALIRLDRLTEARAELERVLTASRHAVTPQGLEDDQRAARRLLRELQGLSPTARP